MKHLLLTTIAAVVLVGCGGANPTGLESHTGTYTLILNNPFWREGLPVDGKVFAEVDYVLAADSTFYTNNQPVQTNESTGPVWVTRSLQSAAGRRWWHRIRQ